MSLKLWKGVAGSALLLGLASPLLMNCNGLPGIPGASCDELKTGDFANFKLEGNAEATAKFKGFLESVFTLDKLAAEMEVGLIASCGELGTAIGMGPAEVKADPAGGEGAKKVCEAVAAKVGGMIKANAEAKLSVEIGEPKCYADIEALTKCFGECGAAISPGEFKAACEGGELAGTCEGDCSGSCSAEAGVQCKGTCSGTCEGKCDGKDSKGNCAGKCDGKCSAGCKLEGGAKCEGTCSGGCSVEIKAPKCTGEFKPPSVSADCQMSCQDCGERQLRSTDRQDQGGWQGGWRHREARSRSADRSAQDRQDPAGHGQAARHHGRGPGEGRGRAAQGGGQPRGHGRDQGSVVRDHGGRDGGRRLRLDQHQRQGERQRGRLGRRLILG
jgi:hypothetical protein